MHIFRGDYFHTEQPSVGSLLWRTTSPTLSFLQLPIGLWVELRPHEHFFISINGLFIAVLVRSCLGSHVEETLLV